MKRDFSLLQNKKFDLLVCGGGIYGAWVAYDAALRGLKVALVEQGDWASATSSASSKLIHGGLRYLESFDFKLVRKALTERSRLLQAAPHRVWPLRFAVPVYRDSRVGTLKLKLGLTLYDFLAGSTDQAMQHHYLDHERFMAHFPTLSHTRLQGGFTYVDAQTDDARLVLELIAGAMTAGAVCLNYGQVTHLLEVDGQIFGAHVQDQQSSATVEIPARQIVFATGQWNAASAQGKDWCRLAKGIHLVMPAVLGNEALLLTAKSDGRFFFMIPWYGLTLLGTTDTDYRGSVEHVTVEAADVSYLLTAANAYLKTAWTQADIIGQYAGVRVLKRSTQSAAAILPSTVSRDWELKTTNHNVHYSIGGKLTSARQDAADIVDTVCSQLGLNVTCATTDRAFPWVPQENFAAWTVAMNVRAAQLGIDTESAQWLIRRHGQRVTEIFQRIENESALTDRILPSLPFIYADLLHCARAEMVVHLEDLLRRRMPLLILAQLTQHDVQRLAMEVATIMNWDNKTVNREIEDCCKQWLHH
ncbi:MAG: glycerol-3-phosphate dehydrogenase/oxidase [Nitrosomonas sp.]|nr:glycerol-3-phosphate dehydrogenase/oxidase [Nitrosomonas sp.]MDP1950742.1 glycerol-3-phosphate dehydrogenase/oxidase [Nitrosomonas sp.]